MIVYRYNNTYHNTTKMKNVDVKSSTYINLSKENNNKDPIFKIGDIVLISQKVTLQIGLKKFL